MLFGSEFDDAIRSRLQLASSIRHARINWVPLEAANSDSNPTAEERANASSNQEEPPDQIDVEMTRGHHVVTADSIISIQGNSVLCTCPDCGVPIAIRMWLRLGDCWRCEASIQISDRAWEDLVPVAESLPDASPAPSLERSMDAAIESALQIRDDALIHPLVADRREAEMETLAQGSLPARLLRRGFNSIPAWLISFLVHLMILMLLALIMLHQPTDNPTITLSTFFRAEKSEGGEIRIENPDDMLVDDLIRASELEPGDEELRDVMQQAERDAKILREDPAPLAPLPDLDQVRRNITTRPERLMSFAARDPRVRAEIVRREGGTSLTEAAVARGLRWLASVQNADGSWSLANYDRHDNPRNRGDAAGTSLALLPFLGAGQTHEFGIYKQNVARGLAWLIDHQKADGDLRADFEGEAGMYAHGQATIVLCEALALTGDQQFQEPAQRAIDFICRAQHRRGGWRYQPRQSGDTSVLGWQIMALQSARAQGMGLDVDPATLKMAGNFLTDAAYRSRRSTLPTGSLYTYLPNQGQPTPSMTAEAILCRMYLGWSRDDPRLMAAVDWLARNHPPDREAMNIYYWYYATQVMHHFGGSTWDKWNRQIREILVSTQNKKGRRAGSWTPSDFQWGRQGGRIYVTSLCVCTLEVYYRHLPLFQKIELEPVSRTDSTR